MMIPPFLCFSICALLYVDTYVHTYAHNTLYHYTNGELTCKRENVYFGENSVDISVQVCRMYVHMYVRMYVYVYVCTYVRMHVHTYVALCWVGQLRENKL